MNGLEARVGGWPPQGHPRLRALSLSISPMEIILEHRFDGELATGGFAPRNHGLEKGGRVWALRDTTTVLYSSTVERVCVIVSMGYHPRGMEKVQVA